MPETITNGLILRDLNENNLYQALESLIKNKSKLIDLQKKSLKNFKLTDNLASNKTDKYREEFFKLKKINVNLSIKKLKNTCN